MELFTSAFVRNAIGSLLSDNFDAKISNKGINFDAKLAQKLHTFALANVLRLAAKRKSNPHIQPISKIEKMMLFSFQEIKFPA